MNLWRVRIDEPSGQVLGQPEPLTTPSPDSAHFSLSQSGRQLAYVQQVITASIQKVGFDPSSEKVQGQPVWIAPASRQLARPQVSPDGEWVPFSSAKKWEEIFVVRADGTGLPQLTDDPYKDRGPCWSPDGKQIAFFSNRSGIYQIWTTKPDGSGLQQVTYASR